MQNEKPKTPHAVVCQPGTFAWCMCGQSKNLPHCDGNHKGTEKVPHIHIVGTETTVYICSCGQSNKKPFCDGSHNN